MRQVAFTVEVRKKTGKEVAKKLRRQGLIPAILYGPQTEPIPLTARLNELKKILLRHRGEQLIFNLTIQDNGQSTQKMALIKELQYHPVTDEIIHADFYEVRMDRPVEVDVPVVVVGKAKGVERGGLLEVLMHELTVSCLPDRIPDRIEIDVSDLDVGDTLHVRDLTPPEGVRFAEDPEAPVVTIVEVEEEGAAEEETEGGEAA
ncbi:50S ribosomal protein L25/general stress protein Ctc [Thermosulfurimonas sp. F29]|uniref:50S ribosomal protein L25/general stress protein Ctc n=1 Tax=Thermosulfurimonas sp. F29 TaxID=2867247 RepID=UPI001C8286B0|nr:50S ribosomal protein L25/general stress protein Ctc [Thermosulfurimonas sp. F29]MBX6422120.1 50S ribosomal protein L25/general stress protein Ctc [Thermosulfurimonas sp. F29]